MLLMLPRLALVLWGLFAPAWANSSFSIKSSIVTDWKFCRSAALQAAEFFYRVDVDLFWEYIDLLHLPENISAAGADAKTDLQVIIDMISKVGVSSKSSLAKLMALNVEFNAMTAALQARSYYSLMAEDLGKCMTLVQLGQNRFTCNLEKLEQQLNEPVPEMFRLNPSVFDYVKYSREGKRIVRVYSIPGSKEFSAYWSKLLARDDISLSLQLLVKPRPCPFYVDPISFSGYGLDISLPDSESTAFETKLANLKMLLGAKKPPLHSLLDYDSPAQNPPSSFTNLSQEIDALQNVLGRKVYNLYRMNSFDMTLGTVDPYHLLDFMNAWMRQVVLLDKFQLEPTTLRRLFNQSSDQVSQATAYDVTSKSIIYINNVEKDERYSSWTVSWRELQKLKKKNAAGVEFLRRNLLTVVFVLNIDAKESELLLNSAYNLVKDGYPFRVGILPVSNDRQQLLDIYSALISKGTATALALLKESVSTSRPLQDLINYRNLALSNRVFKTGSEYVDEVHSLAGRLALNREFLPIMFANGEIIKPVENVPLTDTLMYMYEQELEKSKPLLKRKNADLYALILKTKSAKANRCVYFDNMANHVPIYENLGYSQIQALLNMNHFTSISSKPIHSLLLAGDFSTKPAFENVITALRFTESNQQARLRVVTVSNDNSMANRMLTAALAVSSERPNLIPSVINVLETFASLLDSDTPPSEIKPASSEKATSYILQYANNFDDPKMRAILRENLHYFEILSFDWTRGNLMVIDGKGHVISNISQHCLHDYLKSVLQQNGALLAKFAASVKSKLPKSSIVTLLGLTSENLTSHVNSIMSHSFTPGALPYPAVSASNTIHIGDESTSIFHISAIMDPYNREGQKFSALLDYFSNSNSLFSFSLTFNIGRDSSQGAHLYRYVLPSTTQVSIALPAGKFGIAIDAPSSWLTALLNSNCPDLTEIDTSVLDELEVNHFLMGIAIQGQALYSETNEIADNVHLELYALGEEEYEADRSVVMGNFGYYRFDRMPEIWRIRAFDSSRYAMSIEYPIDSGSVVVLNSLAGVFNHVYIGKLNNLSMAVEDSVQSLERFIDASGGNILLAPLGDFEIEGLKRLLYNVKLNETISSRVFLLANEISESKYEEILVLCDALNMELHPVYLSWPFWLTKPQSPEQQRDAFVFLFLDQITADRPALEKLLILRSGQVLNETLGPLFNTDMREHVMAVPEVCSTAEKHSEHYWKAGFWSDKGKRDARPFLSDNVLIVNMIELRKRKSSDLLRAKYQILASDSHSLKNLTMDLLNDSRDELAVKTISSSWAYSHHLCDEQDLEKASLINFTTLPKNIASTKVEFVQSMTHKWNAHGEGIEEALLAYREGRGLFRDEEEDEKEEEEDEKKESTEDSRDRKEFVPDQKITELIDALEAQVQTNQENSKELNVQLPNEDEAQENVDL